MRKRQVTQCYKAPARLGGAASEASNTVLQARPAAAPPGTRRRRVALVAHGIHDHGGMERAFAELVRRIHGQYDVVVLSTDLGENLLDPGTGKPRNAMGYQLPATTAAAGPVVVLDDQRVFVVLTDNSAVVVGLDQLR